jgi:SAM-dependent methyltransferase
MVCENCWLVQANQHTTATDLFSDNYAYFSSTSQGWLDHAKDYVENIIQKIKLTRNSFVIEVASNDGYLLKNFLNSDIPCLGIEPTASTAKAAESIGIPVWREFFSEKLGIKLANLGMKADLIIGNNVYAHVPDVNDFTKGLKNALKQGGVITLEFPHLLELMKKTQFDTIYHEHFSYFTLFTVIEIFKFADLRVWDVEELNTHGGSLRVYGCHHNDLRKTSENIKKILEKELCFGLRKLDIYLAFQSKADGVKNNFTQYLIEAKRSGKNVAAYGAAAKGNTLLNYSGVKQDLLPVVFDAAISKQGKYMPGSHIPIRSPVELDGKLIDELIILPWNIEVEIRSQLSHLTADNVKFVLAVPELTII